MQLNNKVIISVAGSGKTTYLVDECIRQANKKSIIITYTIDNYKSIKNKLIKKTKVIPPNIEVSTYYKFLLANGVRPYQNSIYNGCRIENMYFDSIPESKRRIPEKNTKLFYFLKNGVIYRDRMVQFVCRCNSATNGAVIKRLEEIYDYIYIDEIQDMAGYDLEFLALLMFSKIKVICVGDHRQSTYSTNNSMKNKKYKGNRIINLFMEWDKKGFCTIKQSLVCNRCTKEICDFTNLLFPDDKDIISGNGKYTRHDGIFFIPSDEVNNYIAAYAPQILRPNKKSKIKGINFGKSKGLEFERVLIKPTNKIQNFFKTGDIKEIGDLSRFYVAITRARQSVAFIYDGEISSDLLSYTNGVWKYYQKSII